MQQTHPDPKGKKIVDDGKLEVPMGNGTSNPKGAGGSLLYNEFIV